MQELNVQLILIVAGVFTTVVAVVFFYFHTMKKQNAIFQQSGQKQHESFSKAEEQIRLKKEALLNRKASREKLTIEDRMFQAGIITERDKKKFQQIKFYAPIISGIVLCFLASNFGGDMFLYGLILGVLLGFQLPFSILDRKTANRSDEIMYYLPLVIEQISIGVSSSLDIGPCLQRVVTMADERDSHNVVTELLRIVVTLARTGLSLEDGLIEVARRAGHVELKHTFGALAQVTRHGGEISRQLQELADSVSSQRETKIESKIKKLELEATGPVAMVFLGFMLILLVGIGLQMMKVFEA